MVVVFSYSLHFNFMSILLSLLLLLWHAWFQCNVHLNSLPEFNACSTQFKQTAFSLIGWILPSRRYYYAVSYFQLISSSSCDSTAHGRSIVRLPLTLNELQFIQFRTQNGWFVHLPVAFVAVGQESIFFFYFTQTRSVEYSRQSKF